MDPATLSVVKYVGLSLMVLTSSLHEKFPDAFTGLSYPTSSVTPNNLDVLLKDLESRALILFPAGSSAVTPVAVSPSALPPTSVPVSAVPLSTNPVPATPAVTHPVAAKVVPPTLPRAAAVSPPVHGRRKRSVELVSDVTGSVIENSVADLGSAVASVADTIGDVADIVQDHLPEPVKQVTESISDVANAVETGVAAGQTDLALSSDLPV